MKSKKIALAVIIILILGTLIWAGWEFLKTKQTDSFTQKEISIKQTEIPDVETVIYDDWAGFRFEYPNILTVKEVELDNPNVYSSLEISGSDGKKLTVRVSDTTIPSLIEWQKSFNQTNSVRKIDQLTLADLPALKLQYGAPEMVLTVAINQGIIYEVTSTADGGFWDQAHRDITAGWQFNLPVSAATGGSSANTDAVTLVEETVE